MLTHRHKWGYRKQMYVLYVCWDIFNKHYVLFLWFERFAPFLESNEYDQKYFAIWKAKIKDIIRKASNLKIQINIGFCYKLFLS